MGKSVSILSHRTAISGSGAVRIARYPRSRQSLPAFAFFAAIAFVLVMIFAPYQAPAAVAALSVSRGEVQSLSIAGESTNTVVRDGYTVTRKVAPKPPRASAPAVGVPDPGTAQAIAYEMVHARGWGDDQYACLVSLFNRESGWNVYAANHSGAYGIPQALPGSKMASAGADWATNPATQITWGLNYIAGRYGTPCGAWGHSQSAGWY